jgi:hypothetical protein
MTRRFYRSKGHSWSHWISFFGSSFSARRHRFPFRRFSPTPSMCRKFTERATFAVCRVVLSVFRFPFSVLPSPFSDFHFLDFAYLPPPTCPLPGEIPPPVC